MTFRLVPKSVTLNDFERRYFTEFGSFRRALYVKVVDDVVVKKVHVRSHLLMSFLSNQAIV